MLLTKLVETAHRKYCINNTVKFYLRNDILDTQLKHPH
jgi:hypothetical protein